MIQMLLLLVLLYQDFHEVFNAVGVAAFDADDVFAGAAVVLSLDDAFDVVVCSPLFYVVVPASVACIINIF